MPKIKVYGFTIDFNARVREITTECGISSPLDPQSSDDQHKPQAMFEAVWDTGATGSVISEKAVKACQLVPTGRAIVYTSKVHIKL